MSSCECIKMENTNLTLKETFKFIKKYPTYTQGKLNLTMILMKISILIDESNYNLDYSNIATNTIYGEVKEVHDTFVKLSYPSVMNEAICYLIAYDSIIELSNETLKIYNKQYLKYMAKLPCICEEKMDSLIFEKHKPLDESIILLINGSLSKEYKLIDIELSKNLIVAEMSTIIPLNQISGYAINSICEENIKTSKTQIESRKF